MYARILFEGVEIGIVRQMLQHHHGDVHLAMCRLHRLLGQCHTVFLLDMDIFEIRDDAQHWDPTDLLQHPLAILKETQIATELIDDDALDELAVFWGLKGDAAIDGGEDTPTVDIPHEDDVSLRMTCHWQVYKVGIPKVDLRDTACPLHHDGVIAGSQTIEGLTHLLPEIYVGGTTTPVIIRTLTADGLTIEHHL